MYIVKLFHIKDHHNDNNDCYLSPWSGDPGRTLLKGNARRYKTERGALIALGMARSIYNKSYSEASVIEVEQ